MVALDPAQREAWRQAARRIAAGMRELAHLPATIDDELCLLAFPSSDGAADAASWAQAISSENVEARVIVDGSGRAGVQLPCRPDASDEEIRHVVLACVKAAHADAGPAVPLEIAAQLDTLRLAEQVIGDVGARLRGLGSDLRQGLGCLIRLP